MDSFSRLVFRFQAELSLKKLPFFGINWQVEVTFNGTLHDRWHKIRHRVNSLAADDFEFFADVGP